MRRCLSPLLVALACAASALAVWLTATRTAWGAWLDERTLAGFVGLERLGLEGPAERIASIVDPVGFTLLSSLVIATALVRRRVALAAIVAVVLLAANATTQALKAGLPKIEAATGLGPSGGSWPSGHTTAVMAVALCAVLVSAPRWRPAVAAGGGLMAVAVVYSLLIVQAHFPSYIVGGYLVAAGWTALGVAALNAIGGSSAMAVRGGLAARSQAVARPLVLAATVAALAAGALALARREAALAYAADHTVFVAAAPVLAAVALALATATAVALRGRR
jgi:membrane-associated phospholipid phosphatase